MPDTAGTARSTLCVIRDALTGNRISLRVRPADSVHSLYEAVCLNMDRSDHTIQLLLAPSLPRNTGKAPVKYTDDQLITLPDCDRQTLAQIGVDFAPTRQHTVIMRDVTPASNAELLGVAMATAVASATLPLTDSPANNDSNSSSTTMLAATQPQPHPPSPPTSLQSLAAEKREKRTRHTQMELNLSGGNGKTASAARTNSPVESATSPRAAKTASSPTAAAASAASSDQCENGTTICAPPPPPPAGTNPSPASSGGHNDQQNGTDGDDVMDVDQDHTPFDTRRTRSAATGTNVGASTSSGGAMLMLCSPPTPQQRTNNGYVGLVNQAMTCYLNSLLQALFMTPEFRNALYKWEYKTESDHRRKCIPFELQKLFLHLQTSSRLAVETTDLTRSFGWDSSDSWQQHDVQELCRVMFDTLEQTFKRTEQADLINRLYEGKMIDYVRCLECQTEKQREDAFLDIPLPVRPFGSNVAYESIEEALSGFVEPEKLDTTNQYFCEKCNCKCDAHKGLKFARFPYILTLHLKRFDFDYQTFHRIKLNDKVTFPQRLNLNRFVKQSDSQYVGQSAETAKTNGISSNNGSATSEHGSVESALKGDDCSTTDSDCGVLDDDLAAISSNSSSNNNNNANNNGAAAISSNANNNAAPVAESATNGGDADLMLMQEDDEGIDVTSTTDTKSSISTLSASGAAANSSGSVPATIHNNESGPYIYDLFAIMIHSGSASGGHYYAYIKEFETCEWYCFNDQSVTPASQEDINKSFGGGSNGTKTYYSGAYSSSTNAYMLMYRQLDPQRNVLPMKPEEFPAHIQQLMQRLNDKKEADRYGREQDEIRVKLMVYWRHPQNRMLREKKLFMNSTQTLEETLADAHDALDVGQHTPLSRCRLVGYDHRGGERVTRSYEGEERVPMDKSLAAQMLNRGSTQPLEFLLETREDGDDDFEPIRPGSISTLVYRVPNLISGDVEDERVVEVRTMETATVGEYQAAVARKLRMDPNQIMIAMLAPDKSAKVLVRDMNPVSVEDMVDKTKVFVTALDAPAPSQFPRGHSLVQIAKRFENILTLYFLLPNTDKETLEKMSIPLYEEPDTTTPATPPPTAAAPAAKRSPNSDRSGSSDVLMSTTPSPTGAITIATGVGQWNATCDLDVVDAHMTVAPSMHHHHQQQHNTASYTVKLPRSSASSSSSAADNLGSCAAITTSATVTLPLTRANTSAIASVCAAGGDLPESNSEDSSLSDSDRTLVDDNDGVGCLAGDLSSTNNSPACSDTQLSSPEYLSRRITTDFDDEDDCNSPPAADDEDLDLSSGLRGSPRSPGASASDSTSRLLRKYYFRATLLDEETAAAVASAASTSTANTTNNGSSSNSSTTGEYGPKQQQQRTLKVKVDKSMIMGNLKQALERYVCVPKEYMKIFKTSQVSESECTSLKQSLQNFKEGERLTIELGRALRKGEYKCKVYYMRLIDCIAADFERLQPVCDHIMCSGADVGSTKRAIISHLASLDPKYNAPYESYRLRRKSFKTPMEVYMDDQKFGDDILISESFELIIQECDEASQPCTSSEDKPIFLRRWNPSKHKLSPFQEIVVGYESMDDFRQLIANVAPPLIAENVEYIKMSCSFPYTTSLSVLSIHTNASWSNSPVCGEKLSLILRPGDMYLYRDKTEPLGELTPEERRAILRAENSSSGYGSTAAYSSPRRERGLKIYLDPSPKKASSFDLMN